MRSFTTYAVAALLSFSLLAGAFSAPVPVQAASFDPGLIISDSLFSARDSMSVADIQAFLVQKNSVLANISSDYLGANANGRSAAQIIFDASRASIADYGSAGRPSNPFTVALNPQVILVTLQKETSLITGNYTVGSTTLTNLLRIAMGMGCPDTGGCDSFFEGFTNQVTYGTAQLYLNMYRAQNNIFTTTPNFKVGDATVTTGNQIYAGYCTSTSVSFTMQNAATSALYRYTPHTCNGNANFYYYMGYWFSPVVFNPTLLLHVPTGAIYAVVGNVRYPIDSMDTFLALGLSMANVRNMTTTEEQTIPVGALVRRLLLDTNGGVSYIVNGSKHPIASAHVFSLRGFHWEDVSPVNAIADYIPYGLPYYELAKSPSSDAIYVMTNSKGYSFPDKYVYENDWGFSWKDFAQTPDYTFAPFPLTGRMTHLVKGSGAAVFLMDGGRRYPIESAAVFAHWNLSWSDVNTFDDRFVGEFPVAPVLGQLAKGSGPAVYLVKDGKKRAFASASAFTKAKYSWANVVSVSDRILDTLTTGTPIY